MSCQASKSSGLESGTFRALHQPEAPGFAAVPRCARNGNLALDASPRPLGLAEDLAESVRQAGYGRVLARDLDRRLGDQRLRGRGPLASR